MRWHVHWLWVALLAPPAVLALPQLENRFHAIHGNDGFLNFAYAHSLLQSGDLDFADDYSIFDLIGESRGYGFRMRDTPSDPVTGRPVNRYGWGCSVLWSPFLILAQALSALARLGVPEHNWGPPSLSAFHFLAVRLGTALWAVLGLAGLAAVARRHLFTEDEGTSDETDHRHDSSVIVLAVLALIACTNFGFYIYLHPSMSTAPAFGLAGLLIWQIDRITRQRTPGRLFALGFTAGLLVATRYGDAAFVAGLLPALWAANREFKGASAGLQRPVTIPSLLAGLLPIAAIQMAVWWYLYGSPISGPTPYLSDDYTWTIPGRHSLEVLFSTHHGWVTWHPAVLLGLVGVVMFVRDRSIPLWLRLTPMAILLQLLAVGAWPVWAGGASFGGRLMATALSVVFFGLVVLIRAMIRRWGRGAAIATLSLLALWNVNLLAQYGLEMIPRQAPVSPIDVLRNTGALLARLFGG
jgi:hypothetical protein